MPSRGVLWVAYGKPARDQFRISAKALRRVHPDWQGAVVCNKQIQPARGMLPFRCIHQRSEHPGARDVKLEMDKLSPFDWTLYLDADTRPAYRIDAIWQVLRDGWEMAAVPTGGKTRTGVMRHIYMDSKGNVKPNGLEERNATVRETGFPFAGIQGGVMAFRKTERVHQFFEVWREEWKRWRGQDQGALARAFHRVPIKCFPLGRAWNSGGLIGHFHGHARRGGLDGAING